MAQFNTLSRFMRPGQWAPGIGRVVPGSMAWKMLVDVRRGQSASPSPPLGEVRRGARYRRPRTIKGRVGSQPEEKSARTGSVGGGSCPCRPSRRCPPLQRLPEASSSRLEWSPRSSGPTGAAHAPSRQAQRRWDPRPGGPGHRVGARLIRPGRGCASGAFGVAIHHPVQPETLEMAWDSSARSDS